MTWEFIRSRPELASSSCESKSSSRGFAFEFALRTRDFVSYLRQTQASRQSQSKLKLPNNLRTTKTVSTKTEICNLQWARSVNPIDFSFRQTDQDRDFLLAQTAKALASRNHIANPIFRNLTKSDLTPYPIKIPSQRYPMFQIVKCQLEEPALIETEIMVYFSISHQLTI